MIRPYMPAGIKRPEVEFCLELISATALLAVLARYLI